MCELFGIGSETLIAPGPGLCISLGEYCPMLYTLYLIYIIMYSVF